MRLIISVVILMCVSPAFGQDVGDTVVVVTEEGAKLRTGKQVIPRGNLLRLDGVDAEHYFVADQGGYDTNQGKRGWIKKRDVLPLDAALPYFNDVISRSPSATDYVIRGLIWRAKGKYDNAIADYNEAIALDPNFAWAYNNRATAWARKGDFGTSIADLDVAIRLDPKYVNAYSNRGLARCSKGEYVDAIADYNKAIRLAPSHAWAHNALAWFLATCSADAYRDGKKAIEHATRACELAEWKDYGYIDSLAAAYAESGDFEEAIKWQTKALLMCHEHEKGYYRSNLELYKSGKPYRH